MPTKKEKVESGWRRWKSKWWQGSLMIITISSAGLELFQNSPRPRDKLCEHTQVTGTVTGSGQAYIPSQPNQNPPQECCQKALTSWGHFHHHREMAYNEAHREDRIMSMFGCSGAALRILFWAFQWHEPQILFLFKPVWPRILPLATKSTDKCMDFLLSL